MSFLTHNQQCQRTVQEELISYSFRVSTEHVSEDTLGELEVWSAYSLQSTCILTMSNFVYFASNSRYFMKIMNDDVSFFRNLF